MIFIWITWIISCERESQHQISKGTIQKEPLSLWEIFQNPLKSLEILRVLQKSSKIFTKNQ